MIIIFCIHLKNILMNLLKQKIAILTLTRLFHRTRHILVDIKVILVAQLHYNLNCFCLSIVQSFLSELDLLQRIILTLNYNYCTFCSLKMYILFIYNVYFFHLECCLTLLLNLVGMKNVLFADDEVFYAESENFHELVETFHRFVSVLSIN